MIKIIGAKRAMIIGILAAFCCIMGAANYMVLMPKNMKSEQQLRSIKSQISEKRAEIDRLQNEQTQINQQKAHYEQLKAAGFFSDQNRLVAKSRIADIQKRTGVLAAHYEIDTGNVEKIPSVEETGYLVLSSPMTISVEAMDDIDIYHFMFWLENSFPGHITIQTLSISKEQDLNEVTLRQIGSGIPAILVKAEIGVLWRTMVSEESVRSSAETLYSEPGEY